MDKEFKQALGLGVADTAMNLGASALQNHFSKKMFERQAKFEKEMFRLRNEYNSPKNQIKRLKEAGLNPNFMFGGVESGTASGGSAPSPTSPSVPNVSHLGQIGSDFISPQAQMQEATAQGIQIENQYKAESIIKNLLKLDEEISGKKLSNEGQEMKNALDSITFNELRQMRVAAVQDAAKELLVKDNMIALGMKELQYYDSNIQANISATLASAMNQAAQANLSREEAQTVIIQRVKHMSDAYKAGLDMKAIQSISDTYMKAVKAKYEREIHDSGANSPWEFLQRFHSDGQGGLTPMGEFLMYTYSTLGMVGSAAWGSMSGSQSSSSSSTTFDGEGNVVRHTESSSKGKSNTKSKRVGKK